MPCYDPANNEVAKCRKSIVEFFKKEFDIHLRDELKWVFPYQINIERYEFDSIEKLTKWIRTWAPLDGSRFVTGLRIDLNPTLFDKSNGVQYTLSIKFVDGPHHAVNGICYLNEISYAPFNHFGAL